MRNLTELLQQAADLINRGENARALGVIVQIQKYTEADASALDEPEVKATVFSRIQEQRLHLIAVQGVVSVVRTTIKPDSDDNRRCLRYLSDDHVGMDAIADALEDIASVAHPMVTAITLRTRP